MAGAGGGLTFALILKAIDEATGPIRKVTGSIAKLEERTRQFGERMRGIGEQATIAGAIAQEGSEKMLGFIEQPLEKAAEFEDHLARLATSLGTTKDKAKDLAIAERFAAGQAEKYGYSSGQVVESLFQGISGFLTFDQAVATSTQAQILARATSGDLIDTTKALTTEMLNFSDPTLSAAQNAQMLADKMAALQTQFKFTSLTELTEAMKEAGPTAKATGVTLDQTFASLATLAAGGLPGEEAGEAFLEIMTQLPRASAKLGFQVFAGANGKGIDLLRTLEGIKGKFGDIAQNKELSARFEEAFGARAGTRIALLLQNLDKYESAMGALTSSTGAAAAAEKEFELRGTLAFLQFHQAVNNLEETIGIVLLPTLARWAGRAGEIIRDIREWTEKHRALTAAILKVALAIGVFTTVASTLLLTFGPILIVMSYVASGIGAVVGIVVAVSEAFALWAGGAATLAEALALVLTPVGWVIAAIAVISLAGYELYEHWAGISELFSDLWDGVKSIFTAVGAWMYTAGAHLMQSFVGGIESMAMAPVHAVESVMRKIRSYLPFSPAEAGPLRDLNRVRIIETIADTMRPAPAIAAMRRLAGAIAIAAPMIAVPAMAPAGAAIAQNRAAVTINYTANIAPGADAADFDRTLRRHAREIADLVGEQLRIRSRKDY